MQAWRLCRAPYAADPLDGRGGLYTSGRWHTRGRRVVYASGSLALAALELLVHVDRTLLPPDLVQVEIEVPDRMKMDRDAVAALPREWRAHPTPPALQQRGDAWLASASAPVLQVPSAVIPEEFNLLINPAHPDAGRIRVVSKRPFTYDRRTPP